MKTNAKHRLNSLLLSALMLASLPLTLTSCRKEATVESIAFEHGTGISYVVGETVQEDLNTLKVTCSDGSEDHIATSDPDVTISGDTSSTGEKTGTATYKGASVTFNYTVYEETSDSVTVTGGNITGYRTLDGEVEIYKGIPFAAPPVDENRWRSPKPVVDWEGVKKCVHFSPSSIQSITSSGDLYIDNWAGVSEDCLYLNVWTNGNENADKPVLVYIHGGGFTTGGASCPIYDGTAIAREGIVYVAINYRLGVYGFLSTPELEDEDDGCGNFATLDVIKALEWVRDNIAAFGGDKDNVTIMGQSAGARMVEGVMISPLGAGLYRNAIVSSGVFTDSISTPAEKSANVLLEGHSLSELRTMSTGELTTVIRNTGVGICNDGRVALSDTYWGAYEKDDGLSGNVNMLIGTVTGDVSLFGAASYQDTIGLCSAFVQARIRSGGSGKNYVYYDDYVQGGAKTTAHTDDVTFWLNNSTNLYKGWSDEDTAMAKTMSAYVINFCKTGDPNGEGLTTWPESTGENLEYLRINNDGIKGEKLSGTDLDSMLENYSELNYLFK